MKSFFLLLVITTVSAARFDTTKTLKDYAGSTFVGTKVTYKNDDGLVEGENVAVNRKLVKNHVNLIQPAVYPVWGGIFPNEKPADIKDIQFDFSELNALVNWGEDNGLAVMHHLLIGHNRYYPDWFKTAEFTVQELDWLMKHLIQSALASNNNSEKVDYWNLINEILDKDGHYLPEGTADSRNTRWIALGWEDDESGLTGAAKINDRHPVFVRKSLEYAATARGKLEIRDFGNNGNSPKSDALYQLIKHMRKKEVRIDAVGMQMHVSIKDDLGEASFRENIRRFHELGVKIYITEFTVAAADRPAGYAQKQADHWYGITKIAREEGIPVICTWGLVDGRKTNYPVTSEMHLFDTNYQKKGAYYEVLRALYETWEPAATLRPPTQASFAGQHPVGLPGVFSVDGRMIPPERRNGSAPPVRGVTVIGPAGREPCVRIPCR